MSQVFSLVARPESKSVAPGKSKLWAALKIDPQGKALEADRAPLAIVLVVDTSGSMQGDPLHQVLAGCELLSNLLDARDQLAIVTFSDNAGVKCGMTTVDSAGRTVIKATLATIRASGNTNMAAGMEVAAGILMTAAPGLRRTMVVMSDGQPNVGRSTPTELAAFVRTLNLAVSTLGFGLHHDENVLDAIATAGSGRYAYIPDPHLARIDLARAALAHGGIVADHLELKVKLEHGVELVSVMPQSQIRAGGSGVTIPVGDIFIDEGRLLALELELDLSAHASARGRLAELTITGTDPQGRSYTQSALLEVDVRAGAPVPDPDAQRDIVTLHAEAARTAARAAADRGANPTAAALLRAALVKIEAVAGFVKNDGTPLAELYEQIVDEITNYEKKSNAQEYAHQRKASTAYKSQTPSVAAGHNRSKVMQAMPAVRAQLVGMNHIAAGKIYALFGENTIGRSSNNEIGIDAGMLSRCHARIAFVTDHYIVQDMGSSNGTFVNGARITSVVLADGDEITFGDIMFRFEIIK